MQASRLENLPVELLDNIFAILTLPDIRNIRLCSRTLGANAIQPRFKSYFKRKKVRLDKASLVQFVAATQDGGLGCLVEELTLESVIERRLTFSYIYDIHKPIRLLTPKPKACIALLGEALRHIQSVGSNACRIRIVRLRLADTRKTAGIGWSGTDFVQTQNRWRPLWICASVSFNIVMTSLAETDTRIKRLRIFDNYSEQRGSLAASTLHLVMQSLQAELVVPLRALKRLTLSLSDPEVSGHLQGLRYILEASPQLEELDLHQFSIGPKNLPKTKYIPYIGRTGPSWQEPADAGSNLLSVLGSTSLATTLPQLRTLRLKGAHTTGETLLDVVQRLQPRRIRLKHITLVTGSYAAFLSHCTAQDSLVVKMHCSGLFEGDWRAVFGVGRHNSVQRAGNASKAPISYDLVPASSRANVDAQARIQELYGPY